MRVALLNLFFILSMCNGYGQFTLSGTISDSSNSPLSFATIIMKDSVKGKIYDTIADSIGFFRIKDIQEGVYTIQISRVNYCLKLINLSISSDKEIKVQLSLDINTIKDVMVSSNISPLIERKADRFVLNISRNINVEGKKTMDLLKYSPGVHVNGDVIKMTAREAVLLLINDQPLYLSGKNLVSYLNSLPIDQISSIEVIPTPSARYDASENTGIINIIMKKNVLPGITGNLKLDYLQTSYSGYFASGNLSYKGKKTSMLALLSGYNANYLNLTESIYLFQDMTLKNHNPKKWNYENMSGQVLFDYQVTEKIMLNLNYGFNVIDRNSISDLANRVEYYNKNKILDSIMYTQGTTSPDANQHNLTLLFDKQLKGKGQKITVQAAWLTSHSVNKRPFSTYTQSGAMITPPSFYKTEGMHRNNVYTVKLDLTLPLKVISFSIGGKSTFIKNNASSDFFNRPATAYIIDPLQSNSFSYTENTQAVYGNLNKTFKKWYFQGGIRAENSTSKGVSATGQNVNLEYLQLFPTAYASYEIDNKNNLSFSYGKRINRPSFEYLDPFKWYINKFFYATGNPFLKPSFVHNVEIDYLYNSNFNAKIFFSKLINGYGRVVMLDPDSVNMQKQTVENYINKETFGVNFYYNYSRIKWLETVLQADFNFETYVSRNSSFYNKKGWGGSFSMYNTIYLTKNKKLQTLINIQETIPGLYEYRDRSNSFNLDIGITYIFPGNHFEANIYASDVTKTSASRYSYTVNNVKQDYKNYFDSRQVMFSIKYKFGNRFIKSISRSLINEDEKNRLN